MALSTSTSCQTSARQSLPFLLLRTNFAANSLPVACSLHRLTTAYCPLKAKYKFSSNQRQQTRITRNGLMVSSPSDFVENVEEIFDCLSSRRPRHLKDTLGSPLIANSSNERLRSSQSAYSKWKPADVEIFGAIDLSHSISPRGTSLRSFRAFA